MSAADLDDPRSSNPEKPAWLFMRLSGVVLVFLALGYLYEVLIADDGVYRVDFNFVAQRWHSPLWRAWDFLLLWLAELHGGNGLRAIIDDYARRRFTRAALKALLAVSVVFTLVVGSYTLLTFDPNIS